MGKFFIHLIFYEILRMFFKEDWDDAKERFIAWWEGDNMDRPLIQAFAPRSKPNYASDGDINFFYDQWGFPRFPQDPFITIKGFRRWCAETYFGGEAYPNLWINLGAGILGAYLGAEPKFESDTVWFGAQWDERLGKSWEELRNIEFNSNNRWWDLTKKITEIASEAISGYGVVGMTDLGGILDVVASLRGPKKLLVDLIRHPEDVKRLSSEVIEFWHACYNELNLIIKRNMEGTSAWMGIWCHEDWYPIQCDFSFMLSPKLFDEFVVPHVKEQCERLDRIIYHLDGPGEIPHLSSLLKIEELDGIQWVPGAGEELNGDDCGSVKWIPLYRKVLEAGKLLVLSVPFHKVIPMLRALGSNKVLVQTYCSNELEAEKLLKEAKNTM